MLFYFGRGLAWLDTGTPKGLLQASNFVSVVQERQGLYISCIEEIAWRKGFISSEKLRQIGNGLEKTDYGKYLLNLLKGR
jgi:glucose-1-phosphate thymidylyltransferase